MGIQGLMKLIGDYAPSAIKNNVIKSYFGKVYPYARLSFMYFHNDFHGEVCSPLDRNTF